MVVRGSRKKEDFYVAGVPVRIERSRLAMYGTILYRIRSVIYGILNTG